MSNVANIILILQEKLKTTDSSLDLGTYAKMVAKLNLNNVGVVSSFDELPNVVDDGNIFLIEAEQELYYNIGSSWFSLGNITSNRVYNWGSNATGQLGDGTIVTKSSPVTNVGRIFGWSQIDSGRFHSLGITGGIAYAWGNNSRGQLGNNSTVRTSSPVTVVGGITNWSQLSAGQIHSLGIAGGVAYAWGYNNNGQLGDGTTLSRRTPIVVAGGITDWTQVSASKSSRYWSLGIANGVAYAWGNNNNGQLGDDSNIGKSSPVTVAGGITNWSQVSAGLDYALGIANGIAYAWGFNFAGKLGDGTAVGKSSPITVIGGITNWSQVSAGSEHSLGIAGGITYAWGSGSRGALGNEENSNYSSPVTVVGSITNWSQVSAGGKHSLAVTDTGILYAWGCNSIGQVGDGTAIDRSSPVTVLGGLTGWTQISSSYSNNAAIVTGLIKS